SPNSPGAGPRGMARLRCETWTPKPGRGRTGPDRRPRPRRGRQGRVRRPVPRPILGVLADDPRLPLWIGRAVLAAAAGIAVMVWQGWRLGVTAAAFVA